MSETLTNTSSPGLAAALEQVAQESSEAEAAVGFGYAVGYIPGVLIVVLGMQLIPVIFKLDAGKENEWYHSPGQSPGLEFGSNLVQICACIKISRNFLVFTFVVKSSIYTSITK